MADKIKCEYDRLTTDDSGTMLLSFRVIDKQLARQMVAKIKGDEIAVTVAKWHNKRSLDANAYFHVLVEKIAKALNVGSDEIKRQLNLDYGTLDKDTDGQPRYIFIKKGSDPLKAHKYPKWVADRKLNDFEIDCYMVYKSTHELDSKEMARLIEGTISEAKELDIETMTPTEMERLISAWGNKYDKKE